MKSFKLKNENFFVLNFSISRFFCYINLNFLQFYFISAKIYNFTDKLIKYKIFYIKKQEFFAYKIFQQSSLFLYES